MGPVVDLLEYASMAADNSAMNLGFVQNQCALAGKVCKTNPFQKGDADIEEYFDGDINAAIDEIFSRSRNSGRWYIDHGCSQAVPMNKMTTFLQGFLTAGTQDFHIKGYQNATWPWTFAGLPTAVFWVVQSPCAFAEKGGGPMESAFGYFQVYDLIPALDSTGRWARNRVVEFFVRNSDSVTHPAQSMFALYADAAYGWPQFPTPISIQNSDVKTLIAQPQFDERTGMNMAQRFRENYPNSALVTSISGGHAVMDDHGFDAWLLLMNFLFADSDVEDGITTGTLAPIDFAAGMTKQKTIIRKLMKQD
jgi:hypothetical protein